MTLSSALRPTVTSQHPARHRLLATTLLALLWPALTAAAGDPGAPPPATTASAFAQPTAFTASYEVRLNNLPFTATARQSLIPLGNDRWRLILKVESFILDTEEVSEFRWDSSNCRTIPERYRYARKGIGRNRSLDMSFDFSKKLATRNNGKNVASFAISDHTEDKLGHTLGLACRIARGARGKVDVDVAWDNDLRHFDYRVNDREETVVTPAGSWQAVRLERQRADTDRVTTSWLAARAGWQAVQMQHSEGDGKLFQLRLLQLQQPAPAAGGNGAGK